MTEENHETQRSQTLCRADPLRHLYGVIIVADMSALPPDRFILIKIKEEACMKYISAKDILPDSLVRELQTYIQGGYIYIRSEYRNGSPVQTLAEKYCLSVHAIRKIIYQK